MITGRTQARTTRQIMGNTDLQETDMCALEIFGADGVTTERNNQLFWDL